MNVADSRPLVTAPEAFVLFLVPLVVLGLVACVSIVLAPLVAVPLMVGQAGWGVWLILRT